jgi:hypothetical protein
MTTCIATSFHSRIMLIEVSTAGFAFGLIAGCRTGAENGRFMGDAKGLAGALSGFNGFIGAGLTGVEAGLAGVIRGFVGGDLIGAGFVGANLGRVGGQFGPFPFETHPFPGSSGGFPPTWRPRSNVWVPIF